MCQLSRHCLCVTRGKDLPSGNGVYNPLVNKPTLIYHADWGSKDSKRWRAKAKQRDGEVDCDYWKRTRTRAASLRFTFSLKSSRISVPNTIV